MKKRARITPAKNILSLNLKKVRVKKGLTQGQAAINLNVNIKRYQAWEEHRAEPPTHMLVAIADLFQIDDLYLFLTKSVCK